MGTYLSTIQHWLDFCPEFCVNPVTPLSCFSLGLVARISNTTPHLSITVHTNTTLTTEKINYPKTLIFTPHTLESHIILSEGASFRCFIVRVSSNSHKY